MYKIRIGLLSSFALLLLFASGCDKSVIIRGRVLDEKGEGLPGVAVTIRGTTDQSITDALGEYSLRCRDGEVDLDMIKSGYTPGHRVHEVAGPAIVDATETSLMALPPAKGVYLYEQFRYRSTTPHEPKPYRVDNEILQFPQSQYGTKVGAQVETQNTQPVLISFRLPPYDVRLSKMELREARDPKTEMEEYREQVWLPVTSLTVYAVPLDETEGTLNQLNLTEPLTPGVYAVHWGALQGMADIESRAFFFRVMDGTVIENIPLETPESAAEPA